MFNRFFSVFGLVTRLPVKSVKKFDPSRLDFYLPVTGLFVSAFAAAPFFAFNKFFFNSRAAPLMPVLIAMLVQYLYFNLFHLDGLCDTADAMLGSADKEKCAAILKDSRLGTYGFFAGIADLTFKVVLLYYLLKDTCFLTPLVFAYPLCGRCAASLLPCITKPAKNSGLGALAAGSRLWMSIAGTLCAIIGYFFVCLGVFCLLRIVQPAFLIETNFNFKIFIFFAILVIFGATLSALYFSQLYKKRLGGYCGDALGAAIETGEILYLALLMLCQTPFFNYISSINSTGQ